MLQCAFEKLDETKKHLGLRRPPFERRTDLRRSTFELGNATMHTRVETMLRDPLKWAIAERLRSVVAVTELSTLLVGDLVGPDAVAAPRDRDTAAQTRAGSPVPEGLFKTRQAAHALGIGERTLREHMRAGSIRYVDVGRGKQRRAPRFAPQDITEFQEQHRGTSWRSSSEARFSTTSSSFEVVNFAE